MYVDGRDPKNPIYVFSKHTNTYLRDEKGSPILFVGDADEDAQGNLINADGNYLVRNQKRVTAQEIHVPSPPETAQTPETPENTVKAKSVAPAIIPPTQKHQPVTHYSASHYSAPAQNTNYSAQPFNSPFANSANAAPAPVYPPTQTQAIYADPYPPRESSESTNNDGTNGLLALIAALLIVIVGGGAGFLIYNVAQNDDDTATENSTPTETGGTEHIKVPAIAHNYAGQKDIPAGARQLDTISTPSGMHHCILNNPDYLECQTTSWTPKQRYGSNNAVRLTKKETPTLTTSPVTGGVTLQYGEVAYNGNWMCGSTEKGITCWSRASSHGFVMNSDGYEPF